MGEKDIIFNKEKVDFDNCNYAENYHVLNSTPSNKSLIRLNDNLIKKFLYCNCITLE